MSDPIRAKVLLDRKQLAALVGYPDSRVVGVEAQQDPMMVQVVLEGGGAAEYVRTNWPEDQWSDDLDESHIIPPKRRMFGASESPTRV